MFSLAREQISSLITWQTIQHDLDPFILHSSGDISDVFFLSMSQCTASDPQVKTSWLCGYILIVIRIIIIANTATNTRSFLLLLPIPLWPDLSAGCRGRNARPLWRCCRASLLLPCSSSSLPTWRLYSQLSGLRDQASRYFIRARWTQLSSSCMAALLSCNKGRWCSVHLSFIDGQLLTGCCGQSSTLLNKLYKNAILKHP